MDSKPVIELLAPQAQPPAGLAQACDGPAVLPNTALNAGPVERLWAQDRVALVTCGDRKAALQRFYAARDKALAGQ